jgi:putative ABC transport system permease protein
MAIRYAVRTLVKTPGFTLIAVVTIALGIAANTAIFSIVNGVLLKPLPFRDEGRVVTVFTTSRDELDANHSAADFMDIRRENRTLESIAGWREDIFGLSNGRGQPEQIEGAWVTSDFFDVLGTPPLLGRLFSKNDNTGRGDKLAVLGYDAWQQLFPGDQDTAGKTLRVNGDAYIVAAVMPKGFSWPEQSKVWLLSPLPVPPAPIELDDPLNSRDVQYFQAIARLKPGVNLPAAQQDLHAIALDIQQKHSQTSGGRDIRARRVRETLVADVKDALIVIQGAVGLVLLIACANVSSLLIARARRSWPT